jgi:hypothetical protein
MDTGGKHPGQRAWGWIEKTYRELGITFAEPNTTPHTRILDFDTDKAESGICRGSGLPREGNWPDWHGIKVSGSKVHPGWSYI